MSPILKIVTITKRMQITVVVIRIVKTTIIAIITGIIRIMVNHYGLLDPKIPY